MRSASALARRLGINVFLFILCRLIADLQHRLIQRPARSAGDRQFFFGAEADRFPIVERHVLIEDIAGNGIEEIVQLLREAALSSTSISRFPKA